MPRIDFEGGCEDGGGRDAAEDDGQRPRHGFLGHETHRQGCRHRPKSAERRAEQHTPDEQHGEVERESRDQVGYQQKDREAEHQGPAVEVSDDRRDEEAGDQRKMAVAETVCPAAPSLILKSAAIGVSRLAGRNSAVTREKTPRANAPTAGPSRLAGAHIAIVGPDCRQVGGRRLSRGRSSIRSRGWFIEGPGEVRGRYRQI